MSVSAASSVRVTELVESRAVVLYEDEIAVSGRLVPGPWGVEVPLPFDQDDTSTMRAPTPIRPAVAPRSVAAGNVGRPPPRRTGRGIRGSARGIRGPVGPVGPVTLGPAEARRLCAALVVALMEVAHGRRARRQFDGRLVDAAAEAYPAFADVVRRAGTTAAVRSVRTDQPCEGVVEAAVVLGLGDRRRALALRLERHRDTWACTRLTLV